MYLLFSKLHIHEVTNINRTKLVLSIHLGGYNANSRISSKQKMNDQAFPQLSHFIKVALFGIVIEKKYMQHTLECVSLTGQEGYFGFPSAKHSPLLYGTEHFFLFYLLCNKSSPLLCIFFEERANATFQLPHIHRSGVSENR